MRGDFLQRRKASRVALDRDDMRALRQQSPRQPAGAGADLDDGRIIERSGGAGDARGEIEVEEKILAERFFRVEPVTRDDLAQRRQSVDHAVIRPASRIASIRLVGSATPLPAMSKAVP